MRVASLCLLLACAGARIRSTMIGDQPHPSQAKASGVCRHADASAKILSASIGPYLLHSQTNACPCVTMASAVTKLTLGLPFPQLRLPLTVHGLRVISVEARIWNDC